MIKMERGEPIEMIGISNPSTLRDPSTRQILLYWQLNQQRYFTYKTLYWAKIGELC